MAIYESDAPDYVTVLLSSNGFDDLSTRTDYLNALHDADMRIADRVASLRDQMAQHTHQVADLKQESDAQAQQLSADKASFLAGEQAANQSATAVDAARSGTQAALSDAQGQVASLEQQKAAQAAAVGTWRGGTGLPRRPLLDPDLHRHVRVGRQLSRAQRVQRGGRRVSDPALDLGAPTGARARRRTRPKAEQDRIAAEIWRDSGPSAWSCA